jgi:hypothetical protein
LRFLQFYELVFSILTFGTLPRMLGWALKKSIRSATGANDAPEGIGMVALIKEYSLALSNIEQRIQPSMKRRILLHQSLPLALLDMPSLVHQQPRGSHHHRIPNASNQIARLQTRH